MTETAPNRKLSGSGIRVLLSLASVVIIVAGLKAAEGLMIPILLGLFLALLSLPILNFLHKIGLPRGVAVLFTVLIDLLILGGIVFLASGVFGEFQDRSSVYAKKLRVQAAEFSETMDNQMRRLGDFWETGEESNRSDLQNPADDEGSPDPEIERVEEADPASIVKVDRPDDGSAVAIVPPREGKELTVKADMDDDTVTITESDESAFPTFREVFDLYWDEDRIVEFVGKVDFVARFTALASQSFFVLIVMIFILAESGRYAQKVRAVLMVRGPDLTRYETVTRDIQKYLAIKTAVSFATGVLATIACIVFNVDFPVLWGLVAFVFNFVPAIGSIIAGVPPIILALILHGFWPAIGVLVCYLIINVVIGNFIEPMLLGDRFGLSTVVIILSVLFWGFIWGPVGMFLAVPLTMVVKVMLDNSSDLRWISAFMGKGTLEETPRVKSEDVPKPGSATESGAAG